MDQQSPELVALTKIDRTVHRFNLSVFKPFFRAVERQKSSRAIIDTFKKSNTARRLSKRESRFRVDAGSNASDIIPFLIPQHKPGSASFFEEFVLFRIENLVYILAQMWHPVGIVPVNPVRNAVKIIDVFFRTDFENFHVGYL